MDYEISWLREDGTPFLFDDGTGDASDPVVRGLVDGVVALYGDSFAVRWLSGQDFRDANRTMGDPF